VNRLIAIVVRRIPVAAALLPVLLTGCASWWSFEKNAGGLDSRSADTRRESALELGRTTVYDAGLRARLTRRLAVLAQSDSDPLVRSAALNALSMQDPKQALDVARRVRTDTSAMVRWDAVKILGRTRDPSLVPVLVELAAGDTDPNTRRECVKALGEYDDPRSIAALIDRLGDSDISVAHAARQSLIRISRGVDLGMKAEPWRKWLQ
jgi:HEAT repeat protein